MKADLKNYTPKNVEYVLEDSVKELFPLALDFLSIDESKMEDGKKLKNKSDIIKFIGKHFNATFPDNELVTRYLDDFEKTNIREEYCTITENDIPQRKAELEEAIEKAKKMKKDAEEAYASALLEVAKYAAEVKLGTTDIRLKSKDVFCIALAGYYLVYNWDKDKQLFVLAKGYEVPDRTELWANEEINREAMNNLFDLTFPEVECSDDDLDIEEKGEFPFGE